MIRLAVLGLVAATLVGCTDNPSILILRNVKPGDDCLVDPGNEVSRSRGILDVTSPLPDGTLNLGYFFTPAISNPVMASMSTPTSPTNPSAHIFFLQGAHVEIMAGPSERSRQVVTALAASGADQRDVPIGGSIEPGGDLGLGFEVIDFEQVQIINQLVAEDLVTVVVRVKVFGTRDDSDVESLPFDYPISVCRGCLIFNAGPCADLGADADLPTGGVCSLTQDEALACCSLASGLSQCPATPPAG